MSWLEWFRIRRVTKEAPIHLERGRRGECAAKRHLRRLGLRFLAANYRSPHGEIDLIFKDRSCLVFVEVKTRATGGWTRPEHAVDRKRRRRLSRAALDYLRASGRPPCAVRFDIVEVLLEDHRVSDIRHLPDAFPMEAPYFYP